MSAPSYHSMFLPITWEGNQRGMSAFSWRDDPLGTQTILSAADYSRCFPKKHLLLRQKITPRG